MDQKLLVVGIIAAVIIAGIITLLTTQIKTVNVQENTNLQINSPNQIVTENIIPNADVEGKDLADVPRPSGFIRANYREDINPEDGQISMIILNYRAKGYKAGEVLNFYKQQLPKYGWTKTNEETSQVGVGTNIPGINVVIDKQYMLSYTKDNYKYELEITITQGKVGGEKITDVEIQWENFSSSEPETPSSHYKPLNKEPQIKEITEYPNAVYYDTNYFNYGGSEVYTDKYYVNDTIDNVFNFYKEHIPKGFNLVSAGIQENEASVMYTNEEGATLMVQIGEETTYGGGTIITVTKTIMPQH